MATRAEVVAMARTFLGTPYHHMGRQPGLALDCAGVAICCARNLSLVPADFDVPAYRQAPDGTLLGWCRGRMREIPVAQALPGDAVALNLDEEPQHLGILGDYVRGGFSLIHARSKIIARRQVGRVQEDRLLPSFAACIVAAFVLPGIE